PWVPLPALGTAGAGAERLALVEEASFSYPRLVLRRHLDVGRAQQEHPVCPPGDASVQPEGGACGEVDEPLSVAVDHLRQIHDHRSALAKVLSDRTSFIVRARVQGSDAGEIG